MMIGMRVRDFGRMHDDTLCALREGVFSGHGSSGTRHHAPPT